MKIENSIERRNAEKHEFSRAKMKTTRTYGVLFCSICLWRGMSCHLRATTILSLNFNQSFFFLSTSSNLIFNSFCERKMPTSFAYLISVGFFYFLLSYFYPHLITLIFIRFISVIIVPFILWVIKDLCTLLAALYYLFVVAATLCTLFMHLHIELIKSLDIFA